MLFLVPIFLSLYLRVLEYKHRFAEYANEGFDDLEHKSLNPGDDQTIVPRRRNPTPVNSTSSSGGGVIDDEHYFWEELAQKLMILFPHEPFCEAALYSFSTNPMKDVV